MVAKTQQGLEPLLAEEIKNLGATNIEEHKRAVSFDGNKEILYKANLHLRTALRILIPIKKFSALNEQQLYDGVKEINWENLEIEENEPNGNSRSFKVKLPKELSNHLYFNISLNLVSP